MMENQNNNEMHLNTSALEFLKESAKWSKFLAIIGFVGIGFMVLAAIFMGAVMSMIPMATQTMAFSPLGAIQEFVSIIYLIIAAIYFFPVYYLYKYANDTKIAIENNDSQLLSNGFGFLKSHHKFLGITMIVVLSFYALMFIGLIAMGLFAASSVI
ncbi:hypothetical protein FPG87_07510 [Flavobacterium psychrophilum]|uniref:DUF5362 family protein n=1 Tax=Flavobacterium psychrophilum TaxID=96345 RepID=UPI0006187697|nr:DUF5362 family protein [Flavobacterium psychrophilum]AKC21291.1 hypothetical protein IY37_03785 [Flavobacterium psychrophilum]EKT4547557.1 hypothetical protein [Flavobacterium psychrophilum]OJH13366.1 hypothetical protein FPG87_07510 [Flavobacterium psychrophilum]